VAENDGDTHYQRGSVRQQEQEDDEKGDPHQNSDHEGRRVDGQQVVKSRGAFNDLSPVALSVFGRLKDQREGEIQHTEEYRRQAQDEKSLAKAGHAGPFWSILIREYSLIIY
jgi:hypothetical protein